jgi:hypothetical protein
MQVTCRTLSGKPYIITAADDAHVSDLCSNLSSLLNIPAASIQLILGTRQLFSDDLLSSLSLTPDDFLVIFSEAAPRRVQPHATSRITIVPPVPAGLSQLDTYLRPMNKAQTAKPHAVDLAPRPLPVDYRARIEAISEAARGQISQPEIEALLEASDFRVEDALRSLLSEHEFKDWLASRAKSATPQTAPQTASVSKPSQPPKPAGPKRPVVDVSALANYKFPAQVANRITEMENHEQASLLNLLKRHPRLRPEHVLELFVAADRSEAAAENLIQME